MQAYLENSKTGKGAWLSLPIHSTEEIEEFIEKNGLATFAKGEEFNFTGIRFDTKLVISAEEEISVPKLNYLLRHYEALDKHSQHKVLAILEAFGNTVFDLEYALDHSDKLTLLESVNTAKKIGQYIISQATASGNLSLVPDKYDYQELGEHVIEHEYFVLTSYGALYMSGNASKGGK
ncbi:MAG: hypothetical protein K0R00_2628 [Herbinix sp.]|nr:hypothetical protein [Herbinix sp.]